MVETVYKDNSLSSTVAFNFHHRVVETDTKQFLISVLFYFNFHHRVVETYWAAAQLYRATGTLTFTIGWLKLRDFDANETSAFIFNFHHRVVET